MRRELLEKLDELIGRPVYDDGNVCYPMSEYKVRKMWMQWKEIRAEIVAERCSNCEHWLESTTTGKTRAGWAECSNWEDDTCQDDDCSHFAKRGS